MKSILFLFIPSVLLIVSTAHPQEFDFGSNGSHGELNLATGELVIDLPPDGVLHYTSVTSASDTTIRFNKNTLNTPVFMLSQGDVLIGGSIIVSGSPGTTSPPVGGEGGPGGFRGGMPGILAVPPGDGHGPGRGRAGDTSLNPSSNTAAGAGAFGDLANYTNEFVDGSQYGFPLLVPIVGGSGGGGMDGQPGIGGGGGGGAILIASNTRITVGETGSIISQGGGSSQVPNPGSGGAIRLLSPTVEGTGTIDVQGGRMAQSGRGGSGLVRIDTLNRKGVLFNFQPSLFGVSIGAFMRTFEDVSQRLDVIEVAGQTIELDEQNIVEIILPFGSDPNQTITVQASGYTFTVPIQIVLAPDSGDTVVYLSEIDMSTGDPAQVTVDVEIPINTLIQIYAWTR